MRRVVGLSVLAVAAVALLLAPVAVATTINDPWLPNGSLSGELNLYQIYNSLYGTTYTNSNQITQVDPSGVFSLTGGGNFVATAHYASNTETFGYYQPTGSPSTLTSILSVGQFGMINVSASVGPVSGLAGFYLTTGPLYPTTWYSEPSLNGGEVHMVALQTPDPNTVLLAWEDLPLTGTPQSDGDYQDLVVSLTRVVPEPTSMALLGIGLAGLVVRRFRRKSSLRA